MSMEEIACEKMLHNVAGRIDEATLRVAQLAQRTGQLTVLHH
jgi:hypothetical protein